MNRLAFVLVLFAAISAVANEDTPAPRVVRHAQRAAVFANEALARGDVTAAAERLAREPAIAREVVAAFAYAEVDVDAAQHDSLRCAAHGVEALRRFGSIDDEHTERVIGCVQAGGNPRDVLFALSFLTAPSAHEREWRLSALRVVQPEYALHLCLSTDRYSSSTRVSVPCHQVLVEAGLLEAALSQLARPEVQAQLKRADVDLLLQVEAPTPAFGLARLTQLSWALAPAELAAVQSQLLNDASHPYTRALSLTSSRVLQQRVDVKPSAAPNVDVRDLRSGAWQRQTDTASTFALKRKAKHVLDASGCGALLALGRQTNPASLDAEVSYALAYCAVDLGDTQAAGQFLAVFDGARDVSPALLEQAATLRQTLQRCTQEAWSCERN